MQSLTKSLLLQLIKEVKMEQEAAGKYDNLALKYINSVNHLSKIGNVEDNKSLISNLKKIENQISQYIDTSTDDVGTEDGRITGRLADQFRQAKAMLAKLLSGVKK